MIRKNTPVPDDDGSKPVLEDPLAAARRMDASEIGRLRAALERHARFRAKAIELLKEAEAVLDKFATESDGQAQFKVKYDIRDFLDEVGTRIRTAKEEEILNKNLDQVEWPPK